MLLRLAVWFYQVQYRVREFLDEAHRVAEQERSHRDRVERERSELDKVRAACRENVSAFLREKSATRRIARRIRLAEQGS